MTNSLLPSGEYVVETPEQPERGAFLEFASQLGRSGCQGFVRPAVLCGDGKITPVQVKQFYESSVDDRGEPFNQNPDKEVRDSYEALLLLRTLGCNVPPYVGIGLSPDGKTGLIMSDLTEEGHYEVFDEKWWHRDYEVETEIEGVVNVKKMSEIFDGLANADEVRLAMLRHSLIKLGHNITLGWGVEHLLQRNPKTNSGELFIADVGEFWMNKTRDLEGIDNEAFLTLPEQEVEATLQELLFRHGSDLNSSELLAEFAEQFPRKKEFLDIYYRAAITAGLDGSTGGVIAQRDWAKRHFQNTDMSDQFFGIKLMLFGVSQQYEHYTNEALIGSGPVEAAFMAVLDQKMHFLSEAHAARRQKMSLPTSLPEIEWEEGGRPRFRFFDNPDFVRLAQYEVKIRQRENRWQEASLKVAFDWTTALHIAGSGGTSYIPIFKPEQIQAVSVDNQYVPDFDPLGIQIFVDGPIEKGAYVRYFYNNHEVYSGEIETQDDIDTLVACQAQVKHG